MSPHTLVPTPKVRDLFFQMAFSLYAGRQQLSLCHYDIKLLNFLVDEVSGWGVRVWVCVWAMLCV